MGGNYHVNRMEIMMSHKFDARGIVFGGTVSVSQNERHMPTVGSAFAAVSSFLFVVARLGRSPAGKDLSIVY